MKQPKIVIFNLNGTLITENSWRQLNLAMGVTEQEDDLLVQWAAEGIISDQQGQNILAEIYKKRSQPSRQNIEKILFNYTYRPDAKSFVSEYIGAGHTVILVTGAMDILAAHVASELSITEWYAANTFVFDANDRLDRIETAADEAEFKLSALTEICQKYKISQKDCLLIDKDKELNQALKRFQKISFLRWPN